MTELFWQKSGNAFFDGIDEMSLNRRKACLLDTTTTQAKGDVLDVEVLAYAVVIYTINCVLIPSRILYCSLVAW